MKKFHLSLRGKVLRMTVLPLIVLAVMITAVSFRVFTHTMDRQMQTEMESQSELVMQFYDNIYPGDFAIRQGESGYQVYKGDENITEVYGLLDDMKQALDVDVSIFYQDTRILTTLMEDSGQRCVNTVASPVILKDVLEQEKSAFYNAVSIQGVRNFAFYAPIYSADGSCFGMIGVCKPALEVQNRISRAVAPLMLVCVLATLVIGAFSVSYSKKIVEDTEKIAGFMKEVSEGNFTAALDSDILKQKDELGDLGRLGLKMQKSIRELVEFDMLTELHNRRYADNRLTQVKERWENSGSPFCVCISDIDFFKKVNDTYGHEAGDKVLKEVARVLKRSMVGKGFATRWGGEEFLLVFEMTELSTAIDTLQSMLEEIRSLEIETPGDSLIHVTMTMGIAQIETGEALDDILRKADARLYQGKTNGRNRIVSQ